MVKLGSQRPFGPQLLHHRTYGSVYGGSHGEGFPPPAVTLQNA
jgi:hypothetical protein